MRHLPAPHITPWFRELGIAKRKKRRSTPFGPAAASADMSTAVPSWNASRGEGVVWQSKETVMPATNFDDFMRAREKAAAAYVCGDGAKVDSIVPHNGAASFHAPTGDTVIGGEAVARRYLNDAAGFHDNGASRFEMLQKGNSGDIGFWTGFQVAKAQIGDMREPAEMRIRVTEIFRRIDGDWKMIHRHADMPSN
jgi:ketosteroid isomerase-like protein